MTPEEASEKITAAVSITREDIARAKNWLLTTKWQEPEVSSEELVEKWLGLQQLSVPGTFDCRVPDREEQLKQIARVFSVRLAFYQAIWELVTANEVFPTGPSSHWRPELQHKDGTYSSGMQLYKKLNYFFPSKIAWSRFDYKRESDVDILLDELDCKALHPGIHEAIEQALLCFRRGLYMPSIAMLAAAAEATWTECGVAVAKNLSNAKLDTSVNDALASIGKKVAEIRKALEQPDGKALLKKAGQPTIKVSDAEVWTTTLRDRRNALHWTKAKSFVADHSDSGILLMAAPMHLGTLEAIRIAC